MKRFLFLIFLTAFFGTNGYTQDSTTNLIEFKDVIINAVKATDKDPFTKVDITKVDIAQRNQGKDLPLLLDNQASLITTSDAGAGVGYSSMRIRGSDQTRINITINGIPVNDAESQQVYFVNTPDLASSANGIQVQRGVGASTNGGGAFGASVNIQNSDFSKKAFGFFNTQYGSFNTWKHTIKGGSGLIKNRFLIEGQLSKISSAGYVDRAASDLWSYHVKAALLFKKTKIQLVHFGGYEKTYQAWYGLSQDSLATNRTFNIAGTDYGARPIAYFNQIDNYRQHYLQAFLTHQINRNWAVNIAAFSTFGKGYYEEFKANQRLAKYELSALTATRGDIVRRRWLDNVFFGGLWGVGYENKMWDVKIGGMAAQYFGNHFGTVVSCSSCETIDTKNKYYYSKGKKTDVNVYAKANYTLMSKIILSADLQYRYVGYSTAGNNNDLEVFDLQKKWHFFNPKIGIKAFVNHQNSLYLSAAIANREPARDELIDNRTDGIKPEQLYNVELGHTFKNTWIEINTNYYLMYYRNQLLLTGRLNDVGNAIKINTARSYRTGLELAVKATALRSKDKQRVVLDFSANAAFSVNRILNFEDRVPTYDEDYNLLENDYQVTYFKSTTIAFSPSWITSVSLHSSPFKNFDATVYIKYVSRQYLDNTQAKSRSIHPYAYGDIQLSYSILLAKNRSIDLLLNINNFWNARYENNGFTYRERYADGTGGFTDAMSYNSYYPQAGIHANGGVNIKF